MPIHLLKSIAKQKKKIAKIEATIAKNAKRELMGIHSRFGCRSLAEFFSAVREANQQRGGKQAVGKARRKRGKITPEVKAKVIAGLKLGKTGAAIAAETGISLPSVQKVKKEAGLVRATG